MSRARDPEQFDVAGRHQPDETADRERQRADDAGRSLGLRRHRLDLALHLFAVTKHARQVAERFGKIPAGLLLNGDDDGEEIGFGRGDAVRQSLHGFADREASRQGLADRLARGAHRLRRRGRDDAEAVAAR